MEMRREVDGKLGDRLTDDEVREEQENIVVILVIAVLSNGFFNRHLCCLFKRKA